MLLQWCERDVRKKQIKVDMSIYRAVIGTSEAIDMEKFNKSTYPNDALEK